VNQCDGCRRGLDLQCGIHWEGQGAIMVCTKDAEIAKLRREKSAIQAAAADFQHIRFDEEDGADMDRPY
jgi:hypothetical protein